MKKLSPLSLTSLCISAFLILLLARPIGKVVDEARHTFRTERYLMLENGNLVFHKQAWGLTPERMIVKKPKSSSLTVSTTGREIEITSHGKKFLHVGATNDIIVSPVNETVFFTSYESLPPSKTGTQEVYARLYRWNEKDGFVAMNPSGIGTSSPTLSTDESILVEHNYGSTAPSRTQIYDVKSKLAQPRKNFSFNVSAVFDSEHVLSIEYDRENSDDAYGQLYRVNLSTDKRELVLPGKLVGRVVSFDGAIWVLVKTGIDYEVVRLSHNLDQLEEVIKVN